VQFHPELKSRPFEPHPLFASFVRRRWCRAGWCCASACVFVFAGGKVREAMPRSMLGVHQFSSTGAKGEESAGDLVSRTQRTTGIILDYMTKMGVSPSIMQAMTASKDIRWLTEKEAFEMNLVTARYAGS
jgi:hypothetical protein